MTPPSLKYFLYVRKSTEAEDKQVASIPSQIEELERLAAQQNLRIIDTFKEEKSAKAPGRPIFTKMVEAIHKGEAQGIICWKLDRLARNPVDGGTVNWMLQQNIIQHIRTYQRSYYPQDNTLLMHLEFGMANQFILDLSINTKRGQRSRIKEGWLPHKPPLGYAFNKYRRPDLPPVYRCPERSPIMKKLWETLLHERCSVEKLYEKAVAMGLKTDKGNVINRSSFYSLFKNPFYYGYIRWNKEIHPGKHEPMITKTQFDLAQDIIENRSFPRAKTHTFAFTGLMRCGECGGAITAEEKTKRQKNGNSHHYAYYRCSKRINPKCTQKTVRDNELENQISNLLDSIEIPPSFHQWAIKQLKEDQNKEQVDRNEIIKSHQQSMDECVRKLDNLFNMRVSEEISASEYSEKKENLLKEKKKYEQLMSDAHQRIETWLERAEETFTFAQTARNRFQKGTLEDKRQILSCLGSNLTLKDRKLFAPLDNGLSLFQKVSPEIKNLHNRLEPTQSVDSKVDWEVVYSQDKRWRP